MPYRRFWEFLKCVVGIEDSFFCNTFFYAQPYWFAWIIAGVLIVAPTLYALMKAEEKVLKK